MTTVLPLRDVLRRRLRGISLLLGLTLARLLSNLGFTPAVANEVYLLAVTAVVLTWCVQALLASENGERLRPSAYGRRRLQGRPDRLVSLEESVPYWIGAAGLRHHRLRPEVAAVAAERLTRFGIDLRTDPRAPRALGPVMWELVRLDVPPPVDEHGAGLTAAQVDDIIASLEALERPDFAVPSPSGDQV